MKYENCAGRRRPNQVRAHIHIGGDRGSAAFTQAAAWFVFPARLAAGACVVQAAVMVVCGRGGCDATIVGRASVCLCPPDLREAESGQKQEREESGSGPTAIHN